MQNLNLKWEEDRERERDSKREKECVYVLEKEVINGFCEKITNLA